MLMSIYNRSRVAAIMMARRPWAYRPAQPQEAGEVASKSKKSKKVEDNG